jgi:deazaflavin-dependent oxidoreductase (nitroreductase family)
MSQAAEAFETPPRDQIPAITRMHVQAMESTDDDAAWVQAGMHCVLLTTRGRRTGKEHKVALPFWRDADGHRIVVASYAGAPDHPAWFLNGCDHDANPTVPVRVQHGAYDAVFEVLDGDEYETVWAGLLADRPWYAGYQAQTERRIPLVRLAEPSA